jgi:two-component system response regulator DevR
VRVLVVDGSAAVSARVAARLGEAGLDVVGRAGTAAAALAQAEALVPDAIVVDLHLPDGSGIELLSALRRTTPGVLLAVHTDDARYRSHCEALGAEYVFDKSSELDGLVRRLARAAADPSSR